MVIGEAFDILEEFLEGNYGVSDFITDISVIIDMDYEEMKEENEEIASIFKDKLLKVCDNYEEGTCLATFMKKVEDIYDEAKKYE